MTSNKCIFSLCILFLSALCLADASCTFSPKASRCPCLVNDPCTCWNSVWKHCSIETPSSPSDCESFFCQNATHAAKPVEHIGPFGAAHRTQPRKSDSQQKLERIPSCLLEGSLARQISICTLDSEDFLGLCSCVSKVAAPNLSECGILEDPSVQVCATCDEKITNFLIARSDYESQCGTLANACDAGCETSFEAYFSTALDLRSCIASVGSNDTLASFTSRFGLTIPKYCDVCPQNSRCWPCDAIDDLAVSKYDAYIASGCPDLDSLIGNPESYSEALSLSEDIAQEGFCGNPDSGCILKMINALSFTAAAELCYATQSGSSSTATRALSTSSSSSTIGRSLIPSRVQLAAKLGARKLGLHGKNKNQNRGWWDNVLGGGGSSGGSNNPIGDILDDVLGGGSTSNTGSSGTGTGTTGSGGLGDILDDILGDDADISDIMDQVDDVLDNLESSALGDIDDILDDVLGSSVSLGDVLDELQPSSNAATASADPIGDILGDILDGIGGGGNGGDFNPGDILDDILNNGGESGDLGDILDDILNNGGGDGGDLGDILDDILNNGGESGDLGDILDDILNNGGGNGGLGDILGGLLSEMDGTNPLGNILSEILGGAGENGELSDLLDNILDEVLDSSNPIGDILDDILGQVNTENNDALGDLLDVLLNEFSNGDGSTVSLGSVLEQLLELSDAGEDIPLQPILDILFEGADSDTTTELVVGLLEAFSSTTGDDSNQLSTLIALLPYLQYADDLSNTLDALGVDLESLFGSQGLVNILSDLSQPDPLMAFLADALSDINLDSDFIGCFESESEETLTCLLDWLQTLQDVSGLEDGILCLTSTISSASDAYTVPDCAFEWYDEVLSGDQDSVAYELLTAVPNLDMFVSCFRNSTTRDDSAFSTCLDVYVESLDLPDLSGIWDELTGNIFSGTPLEDLLAPIQLANNLNSLVACFSNYNNVTTLMQCASNWAERQEILGDFQGAADCVEAEVYGFDSARFVPCMLNWFDSIEDGDLAFVFDVMQLDNITMCLETVTDYEDTDALTTCVFDWAASHVVADTSDFSLYLAELLGLDVNTNYVTLIRCFQTMDADDSLRCALNWAQDQNGVVGDLSGAITCMEAQMDTADSTDDSDADGDGLEFDTDALGECLLDWYNTHVNDSDLSEFFDILHIETATTCLGDSPDWEDTSALFACSMDWLKEILESSDLPPLLSDHLLDYADHINGFVQCYSAGSFTDGSIFSCLLNWVDSLPIDEDDVSDAIGFGSLGGFGDCLKGSHPIIGSNSMFQCISNWYGSVGQDSNSEFVTDFVNQLPGMSDFAGCVNDLPTGLGMLTGLMQCSNSWYETAHDAALDLQDELENGNNPISTWLDSHPEAQTFLDCMEGALQKSDPAYLLSCAGLGLSSSFTSQYIAPILANGKLLKCFQTADKDITVFTVCVVNAFNSLDCGGEACAIFGSVPPCMDQWDGNWGGQNFLSCVLYQWSSTSPSGDLAQGLTTLLQTLLNQDHLDGGNNNGGNNNGGNNNGGTGGDGAVPWIVDLDHDFFHPTVMDYLALEESLQECGIYFDSVDIAVAAANAQAEIMNLEGVSCPGGETECSGKGECGNTGSTTSNVCWCYDGYYGFDCSQETPQPFLDIELRFNMMSKDFDLAAETRLRQNLADLFHVSYYQITIRWSFTTSATKATTTSDTTTVYSSVYYGSQNGTILSNMFNSLSTTQLSAALALAITYRSSTTSVESENEPYYYEDPTNASAVDDSSDTSLVSLIIAIVVCGAALALAGLIGYMVRNRRRNNNNTQSLATPAGDMAFGKGGIPVAAPPSPNASGKLVPVAISPIHVQGTEMKHSPRGRIAPMAAPVAMSVDIAQAVNPVWVTSVPAVVRAELETTEV